MTGKQIKEARKSAPRFSGQKLTDDQVKMHRELDCREMINSCLCYGSHFINSDYKDDYIKDLGEKRVVELYYEQLKDFEKSKVNYNVYEDGEGCTYNSIQWRDD